MGWDNNKRYVVDMEGGAEEWAIYGWFKGERTGDYWTQIWRVTPNENYGNADYIGDRDFAMWLSWPNNAIHMATSQIYGDDWNRYSWFQREDSLLEDWFFVYQGYSWAKKKSVAYIRTRDYERIINFNDQHRYIPH